MPRSAMRRVAYAGSHGPLALGLTATLLLGACASKVPQGSRGGRIDPYRSTPADEASRKAGMPDLYQFADETAEKLARELADIPEIENAPEKVVLELGDILNQTRTPTGDFELIQNRLRSQLRTSRVLRNRVMFVEGRARMNRELARINGGGSSGDLLQEGTASGGGAGGTARYAPEKTYVLQGDFQEATRGSTRRYLFIFRLVNLVTREIVWDKSFDSAMG